MQLVIANPIPVSKNKIEHAQPIMLIGSCFTENMGKKLDDRFFTTYQNPHGILFNPVSVHACIQDIVRGTIYTNQNLFYLHEQYHSWLHHTRFSGNTAEQALQKINNSIAVAHNFLGNTKHIIITLGSAFAYRHNELDMHVSNNHRAPSQWFTKELLPIGFIQNLLQRSVDLLLSVNPTMNIIFTISPVRHLRDGVVQNNRSKARLIEAVHEVVNNNEDCCTYFPSYEIVMDELRDYRFYDADMAHPNYSATNYVWEKFTQACINQNCLELMDELQAITTAFNHKAQNQGSQAHNNFLNTYYNKCLALKQQYPYLNLEQQLHYFKVD
jgi:hypothetical protein